MTVTIFFRATDILGIARNLARGNLDGYMWIGDDRSVFYANGPEPWIDSVLKIDAESAALSYNEAEHGKYFETRSRNSSWRFISYISEDTMARGFIKYFYNIILLFLLLYSLTTIFLAPVISRLLKPLGRLSEVMDEVADGNIDAVSDVDTNDEIGELSHIFNKMLTGYYSGTRPGP